MVFNQRTVSTHAAAWKYHELIIVVVVAVVVHILFLVLECVLASAAWSQSRPQQLCVVLVVLIQSYSMIHAPEILDPFCSLKSTSQ